MRRRHIQEEETENNDRWLVSYADFITLLFAFFVMMYSISSVNEGKYRVLADSMVSAFSKTDNQLAQQKDISNQQASAGNASVDTAVATTTKKDAMIESIKPAQSSTASPKQDKLTETLREKLSQRLKTWANKGLINIDATNRWVDIEIGSEVLFKSGSADISTNALGILQPLAYELLGTKSPVYVLGYTDNVPIYTQKYTSNWELSAARAVSVVDIFAGYGLNADLLGAIGFGEQRPIASNATAEGRRKNRRVVIRIFTSEDIFLVTNNNKKQP